MKRALFLSCGVVLGLALGVFLMWAYYLRELETTLQGALRHQYWGRRSDCGEAYAAGGEIAEFGLKKAISLAHFYYGGGVIDAAERDFDIFVCFARMAKSKRDSGDEDTSEQYIRQALSLARTLKIDDTISEAEQLFDYLGRIDALDSSQKADRVGAGAFPEDADSGKSAGEQ